MVDLILIVLFLLINSLTYKTVKSEEKNETSITGDIDCRRIHEHYPITVRAATRTEDGDIYMWLQTAKDVYLTRLKAPKDGEWFRVYDHYPKAYKNWFKDFTKGPLVGIKQNDYPQAAIYYKKKLYLISNKHRFAIFYNYNRKEDTFDYDGYDAIVMGGVPGVSFKSIIAFYFVKNRVLRLIYNGTVTATGEVNSYIMDVSPPKLYTSYRLGNISETRPLQNNVHGGFMLFDFEKSSFGYSFQSTYSVPLAAGIQGKVVSFGTIVKTKYSKSVETGNLVNGFDGIDQPHTLIIPNELWLGCPVTDTCFHFRIDDAVKIADNKLFMFAGRMVFELSSLKDKLVASDGRYIADYFDNKLLPSSIDAAFTVSDGYLFLFKDKDIYVLHHNNRNNSWELVQKRDSFLEHAVTIEAAVRITSSNTVYVFHGLKVSGTCTSSIVSEYNIDNFETTLNSSLTTDFFPYKYYPQSSKFIEDINAQLPAVIDAAFIDPTSSDIILVKNNFFMRINSDNFYKYLDKSNWQYSLYFECNTETMKTLLDDAAINDYKRLIKPIPFINTCQKKSSVIVVEIVLITLLITAAFIVIMVLICIYFKGDEVRGAKNGGIDAILKHMKSKQIVPKKTISQAKADKLKRLKYARAAGAESRRLQSRMNGKSNFVRMTV